MVTFVRSLCFVLFALLVACGGSTPEDLFPNGKTEEAKPPNPPASVPNDPVREKKACPDLSHIADVVPDLYYLTDTCCDQIQDLGLAAEHTSPALAWSPEKRQLYQVTGRVEGGIYLKLGDKCVAGGPYEGYDLFTLKPY